MKRAAIFGAGKKSCCAAVRAPMGRARLALLLRLVLAAIVSLHGGVHVAAENGIQWLGDACNDDDDCNDALNLRCDQHRHCTCKDGYVSVQFGCKTASRLGEACFFPNQCQYYDPHSVCDASGRCSCFQGFHSYPDRNNKCYFNPPGDSYFTPFSTGVMSFGLFAIILTGIIGVICMIKFIMCTPLPPQPQRQPHRRCSRKHTYLKMNYFRGPAGSEGEKRGLLEEVKQPPSYLEATGVPQIVITDYSTIQKPTTSNTSA